MKKMNSDEAAIETMGNLRFFKKPVSYLSQLYRRYPKGGEYGWFTFVYESKTFAYWDVHTRNWRIIEGTGTLAYLPYIGSNGNWWIDDQDTGMQAKGDPGKDGETIGGNYGGRYRWRYNQIEDSLDLIYIE